MRTIFILALGALLASGAGAAGRSGVKEWPAEPPSLVGLADVERAAAAFPNSMGLQRRRLAAALQAKDVAVAVDATRRLAAAGAGLSPASRAQVEAVLGTEAMKPLNARFEANAGPVGTSEPFLEIPPHYRLIEGLAVNPGFPDLYVTSVVDRQLIAVHPHGGSSRLNSGEAGSLLGVVFDPRSRRLWAASAMLDETPKAGRPFGGLIGVDPANRKSPIRIPGRRARPWATSLSRRTAPSTPATGSTGASIAAVPVARRWTS